MDFAFNRKRFCGSDPKGKRTRRSFSDDGAVELARS